MDTTFLQSMLPRPFLVTHVTRDGDAFGQDEKADQVYIPRSLTLKFPVNVGDIVKCKVVKNTGHANVDRCPWKAYFVNVETAASAVPDLVEDEPHVIPEELIIRELSSVEMMSTADVAELLGADTNYARPLLEKMHKQRLVVRADIYTSAGQTKASRSVWAAADVFIPLNPEFHDE